MSTPTQADLERQAHPVRDSSPPSSRSAEAPWYKDAVLYELHVRAFGDSNGDGIGDFEGLVEKLDYLQDLGVTALWLLPFYPSPLRDGGYDIADYTGINPAYGTRRDFTRLLREAHRRGLRVITELVLNHTSSEHPWFKRAREAPPGSPWRRFYVWSDTQERYADARIIFKDFETSNWAWDPVAKAYYWHRFYSHQPDLNFDNPEVHEALFKVVDFWFDLGVDGLRLDAVPYLYEREGTICENLAETHALLRKLRAHVDGKYQDRMLLAEANQWPVDAAAYFGAGDECHMCFHFPLMPRMFMAVQLEDSFPIINILKQTPAVPESCQWATFLRNHDELTLEMVTDEDRDYMYRVYAQDRTARINLGIRRRLAPLLKVRRRIELMNALLFSLPGTPVLYYGDEIGMGDNIYLGDRDGVRTPMQWSADRNGGFSRANPQQLYLPLVVDPEYHYQSVNVEAQQANPSSLLWWMKRLIALRKQHRVFGRGSIELLHPDSSKVLAFVRTHAGESVLVVANLSRFVQSVELDLSRFEGAVPVELFGRARFPAIGRTPYFLSLGPHDFFWFALETRALPEAPRAELPSLSVKGTFAALLSPEERRKLEPVLLEHAATRPWFQGGQRARKGATIADIVPLGGAEASLHLVLLRVEYIDGSEDTYVLPLAFETKERASQLPPHALIARVISRGTDGRQEGALVDALYTSELACSLLESLRGKSIQYGERGQLSSLLLRGARELVRDASLSPRVPEAEPSIATLVYGDKLLLKVFRKVEEGVNAEYEVGRFLTERGFRGVPRMAGAIEHRARGQEPTTVAILEELVERQGRALRMARSAASLFFESVLSVEGHGEPPPAGGSLVQRSRERPPEAMASLVGPYRHSAELLGRRTAELHLALASDTKDPAFAPEPFTMLYQQSIFQSAQAALSRNFELLRRHLRDTNEGELPLAQGLLRREAEVHERLRRVVLRKIQVSRIRCHGDLHLGKVLSTGDDFVITDLEGDPGRPLAERRYKRCPLRDVAGMMRSFHHASAGELGHGKIRPEDVAGLAPWAAAWSAWVSAAYLGGYLAAAAGAPFVPKSDEDTALLLDFYLVERCIQEIGAALASGPERLAIALGGLARMMGPAPA